MKNRSHLLMFNPLVLCLAAGCGKIEYTVEGEGAPDSLKKMIGENVKVQFRRDALGASERPIDPYTDESNGASMILVGKLTQVEAGGIVINSGRIVGDVNKSDRWIPRDVILYVQTNP